MNICSRIGKFKLFEFTEEAQEQKQVSYAKADRKSPARVGEPLDSPGRHGIIAYLHDKLLPFEGVDPLDDDAVPVYPIG